MVDFILYLLIKLICVSSILRLEHIAMEKWHFPSVPNWNIRMESPRALISPICESAHLRANHDGQRLGKCWFSNLIVSLTLWKWYILESYGWQTASLSWGWGYGQPELSGEDGCYPKLYSVFCCYKKVTSGPTKHQYS